MDFNLIWKAVLMVVGGTFLLQIAGRKSISQMTLSQVVIMIGIGSLLIQPVADENIWVTLLMGLMLVLTLILMEYLQIKFDPFEKLVTGKSKILIKDGVLQEKNLKKLRMTVDQLEMNLRQQSISNVSDVQWATLEPNGRVGLMLKPEAQPVTKKEFQQLLDILKASNPQTFAEELDNINKEQIPPEQQENIFAEVNRKFHKNDPPKHLR